MHICIYIYIHYIHIYVYVYICVYVNTYTYIYTHTHIYSLNLLGKTLFPCKHLICMEVFKSCMIFTSESERVSQEIMWSISRVLKAMAIPHSTLKT